MFDVTMLFQLPFLSSFHQFGLQFVKASAQSSNVSHKVKAMRPNVAVIAQRAPANSPASRLEHNSGQQPQLASRYCTKCNLDVPRGQMPVPLLCASDGAAHSLRYERQLGILGSILCFIYFIFFFYRFYISEFH